MCAVFDFVDILLVALVLYVYTIYVHVCCRILATTMPLDCFLFVWYVYDIRNTSCWYFGEIVVMREQRSYFDLDCGALFCLVACPLCRCAQHGVWACLALDILLKYRRTVSDIIFRATCVHPSLHWVSVFIPQAYWARCFGFMFFVMGSKPLPCVVCGACSMNSRFCAYLIVSCLLPTARGQTTNVLSWRKRQLLTPATDTLLMVRKYWG